MLTAYGLSHRGHVRAVNEDAWHSSLPLGLFVVADGMGGHRAGEVASTLAVDAIVSFIRETQNSADITWPYPIDPRMSFAANRLRMAITLANHRVCLAARERPECAGMGTTVVAALIEDHALAFGSVGDSRMYSLVDDRLTQLTIDDTVDEFSSHPRLDSRDHPARHRVRRAVSRAIGTQEQLQIVVLERLLRVDETLLLCSDGLYGSLSDPEIAVILGSDTGTPQLAERLVRSVLDRHARDNVTAVVVRVEP